MKKLSMFVAIAMFLTLILTACQPQTIVETVEVQVEKIVKETVVVEKQVEKIVEVTPQPTLPTCSPAVDVPSVLVPGKLVMSINPTIPPTQYMMEDGTIVGHSVDVGNEVARRLCLTPEYVNIQFDAMIPGLHGGRWDMINTGLYWTEERAADMELVPYKLQAMAISTAAGNPLGIKTVEDLSGKKVAVECCGYEETKLRELDKTELLDKGLPGMEISTFNTFAEAFLALSSNQVEAVVSGDNTAKFHENEEGFDMVFSGLYGRPAALAFENTELATAAAKVMQDMYDEGWFKENDAKYGVTGIDEWEKWEGEMKVW